VSVCATCDGAFFRDKVVAVIGGGDSAMEESTFLTRFAKKVYLIHRRPEFRASEIMQKRVRENEKIEIILNATDGEIIGDEKVEKIKILENGVERVLDVDGVFMAIGHIPATDFLNKGIELNEEGYIKSFDGIHTSIDGGFVAGDVEDSAFRQAITAAGAGCRAALTAERFLRENK
jgi:thioredoxin reductase (NADPH)